MRNMCSLLRSSSGGAFVALSDCFLDNGDAQLWYLNALLIGLILILILKKSKIKADLFSDL